MDLFSPSGWVIMILAAVAAGFVDAIAGGGGLITLPAWLGLAGVPPIIALGTNKLNATLGTATATWVFYKRGLLRPGMCLAMLFAALGGGLGTLCASSLDTRPLRLAIPLLLLSALSALLLQPTGWPRARAKIERPRFDILFGLGIGFYDGFFGPGTGSLWLMCLVMFAGSDFRTAAAQAKLLNLSSNIVSLSAFAFAGHVIWGAGVWIAIAQMLGNAIGARVTSRHGESIIRPMLIAVVIVVSVHGIWKWLHQ